jgi:hypothetical protein
MAQQRSVQETAPSQYQQAPPPPSQYQQAPQPPSQFQQQVQPTVQMMMQSPVNAPAQSNNVMQQMQNQAGMYSGGMPQSAPLSEFLPMDEVPVHRGPLKSELLPDPMFFQNPPPPPKIKKVYVEKVPEKKTFLGFDSTKIKSAILVAAIVFALISYVAPLMAKNIPWAVNIETGKFTSYGLVTISLLTGGLYLGVSELINRFGNGMN